MSFFNQKIKDRINLALNFLASFTCICVIAEIIDEYFRLWGAWSYLELFSVFLLVLLFHISIKWTAQKHTDDYKKITNLIYSIILGLGTIGLSSYNIYYELYVPHRDGPSWRMVKINALISLLGFFVLIQQKWAFTTLKVILGLIGIVLLLFLIFQNGLNALISAFL